MLKEFEQMKIIFFIYLFLFILFFFHYLLSEILVGMGIALRFIEVE
jgi:hypothetical protein